VTAGQTVLNLVPRGDTLVVEARVRPEDIDRVVVGSPGNVRLLPYSQRRTPPVAATVIYVSADRLTDKKTEAPYYAVRLKLDPERLSELPEVKVLAGMPAEAMIKTGVTTVALYAFAPILDTFHKAFRAR
jgi:HlyD family secretion protein